MQVISGKLRGLKIITPEGEQTRPTLSRVKEAFFSSIQIDIVDTSFLDMFAGTGQMGIEALSRGAARVVFIDTNTTYLINDNLQKIKKDALDSNQSYKVLSIDITKKTSMESVGETFDYIYIDPPQKSEQIIDFSLLLDRIKKTNLIKINGTIILEQKTDKNQTEYLGYNIIKHKIYGKTMLTYLMLIDQETNLAT